MSKGVNKLLKLFQIIKFQLFSIKGYWGENLHSGDYHFFSHIQELGGEGLLADLKLRMSDFWNEILPQVKANTLICSHGDPLQVLYSYIHNLRLVDDSEIETNIPGWIEKGEFEVYH